MRRVIMQPYFHAWHTVTLASGHSNAARRRAAFQAWRGYCADLDHLHVRIIAWMGRVVEAMGGLHLTWTLCTPVDTPDTGAAPRAAVLWRHKCGAARTALARALTWRTCASATPEHALGYGAMGRVYILSLIHI